LQPRFHLEMGLVRLVHAGRLVPIEQALADLKGGSAAPRPAPQSHPAPQSRPANLSPAPATARASESPAAAAAVRALEPPSAGDERNRLHAHLLQKGLAHLADAVENSRVTVVGGELQILTAKSYKLYFEDSQFAAAIREIFGRPLRTRITVGDAGEQAPATPPPSPKEEDDTARRALANPEVRRFREVFGGEVRTIRNLKE